MSAADRAYAVLLRAYPSHFRAAYGQEMARVFRDCRREDRGRGVRFWLAMVWDVAQSAPRVRMASWSRQVDGDFHPEETNMQRSTMAVLAIVIGAVEIGNCAVEGWVGGVGNGDSYSLQAGVLGIVAGTLMLASGVAMLRRTGSAARLAQVASVVSLAVFLLIGVIHGRMSIFATLLGTVFPVALMVYVRMSRGSGTQPPMLA